MSHACCTATKPNGQPCAARPLPDSDFCLFHDPTHQEDLAASRSKGGSTPRRRVRRFPRVLDHLHVAELLSELFVDALNDPELLNTKRLQALTRLAQVILKAVGVPKDAAPLPTDRREPTPAEDCLLRLYPPLAPEVEALLAGDPPAPANDQGQPLHPGANATPQPLPDRPTPQRSNIPMPERLNARTPERLTPEQVGNRSQTGGTATNNSSGLSPGAVRSQRLAAPADGAIEEFLDLLSHTPYPLSFQLPAVAVAMG